MSDSSHKSVVQKEFNRQAAAFVSSPVHSDPRRLQELVEFSGVGAADRVLDVACGPGLVMGAFAARARTVVGIDLTEKMLSEATRHLAAHHNTRLVRGDVDRLPFAGGSFDVVVSRFALHHISEPERVVREMSRVLRRGGRFTVLDHLADDDPAKAAYHNEIEIWRDPSHVRCLSRSELCGLFESAGLELLELNDGSLELQFEEWARRTFQSDERVERAREMLLASIEVDRSGLAIFFQNGELRFRYKTLTVVGRKP